jgi:hypothetical protein
LGGRRGEHPILIKITSFSKKLKCWKRRGIYPVPKLEWTKTLPQRLEE